MLDFNSFSMEAVNLVVFLLSLLKAYKCCNNHRWESSLLNGDQWLNQWQFRSDNQRVYCLFGLPACVLPIMIGSIGLYFDECAWSLCDPWHCGWLIGTSTANLCLLHIGMLMIGCMVVLNHRTDPMLPDCNQSRADSLLKSINRQLCDKPKSQTRDTTGQCADTYHNHKSEWMPSACIYPTCLPT